MKMTREEILAAIEGHRLGIIQDLTAVFNHVIELAKLIEALAALSSTPLTPWYTTLAVNTRLKVIKPEGVLVYMDTALVLVWALKKAGDLTMTVQAPYDLSLDPRHLGILCVYKPNDPYPNGLWIAAVEPDGTKRVEVAA
jgi:hypothetical protein